MKDMPQTKKRTVTERRMAADGEWFQSLAVVPVWTFQAATDGLSESFQRLVLADWPMDRGDQRW